MDLESAAQCEMSVYDHACRVTSLQLGRTIAANIRFEGDVVNKTSRELETIAKDHHTATQDAQLDNFIPEAISRSDTEVSEVSPGDLDFSSEAIVRDAWIVVQSRLPARVNSNHWLEPCLDSVRTVKRFRCLLGDSE